jgi:deoxyxylulose-5-phosphate synthase
VAEVLNEHGIETHVLSLGIPDQYLDHGARDDCLRIAGLDPATILRRIRSRMAALGLSPAAADHLVHSGG